MLMRHIVELTDENTSYVMQESFVKGWFAETDVFDSMPIAIGMVNLKDRSGDSDGTMNPSFGEIGVYERTIDQAGSYAYSQLQTRPCFKEELGLDSKGKEISQGGTRFHAFDTK